MGTTSATPGTFKIERLRRELASAKAAASTKAEVLRCWGSPSGVVPLRYVPYKMGLPRWVFVLIVSSIAALFGALFPLLWGQETWAVLVGFLVMYAWAAGVLAFVLRPRTWEVWGSDECSERWLFVKEKQVIASAEFKTARERASKIEKVLRDAEFEALVEESRSEREAQVAERVLPPRPKALGVVTPCANCEEPIGKLEVAHPWGDKWVCGTCQNKLSPKPAPLFYMGPSREVHAPRQTSSDPVRDNTGTRLIFLLIGLIFPPFLLVWLILGAIDYSRRKD